MPAIKVRKPHTLQKAGSIGRLQFEVSTSLIYKWRRDHLPATEGFSRVVLAEAPGRRDVGSHEPVILVELDQVRVSIGASAPASLVTATLRALR